jgi:hypothetical protein
MRRRPDPQHFRHAVLALCRLRARQRVKDQIRAKGLKPQHYTARQIADLADEYVKGHLEELVTRATADVASWPEFAGLDAASVCIPPGNRTLPGQGDDNLRTNQQ